MLFVADNLRQIHFGQLMKVYSESNRDNAATEYRHIGEAGLIEAEQDFYAFLRVFMQRPGAFAFFWIADDEYVSSLRAEPYRDGYLIEGLETAPESRQQGYATKLLAHTVQFLTERGVVRIYSHISQDNQPSIRIHSACGFARIDDIAVYVDGSVDSKADTYLFSAEKQGANL